MVRISRTYGVEVARTRLVTDAGRSHLSNVREPLWSTGGHPGCIDDVGLRVEGVASLRIADASVMPNVVSGNTNAASIMIGEKAAEMIARDHNVTLNEFVGLHS